MLHDNIIDTEVEFVEWNITKWNILKPRIKITPINLCGVTIQYATGFNAKYIQDNSIGKGAIVSVTRSNDVIPYIVNVKKPGIVEFPNHFAWNDTGVDIVSVDNENVTSEIKIISSFFSELGIKHVSDSTILKMFNSGYNTLIKILNASKGDLLKIEGIADKSADRIVTNIHTSLKTSNINDVICASSCFGFGFGKKKIQKLLQHIPNFPNEDQSEELLQKIMEIEGFSEKTAKQAMDHIPQLQKFIIDILPFIDSSSVITTTKCVGRLEKEVIVFSGFRNKELEAFIISNGGTLSDSINKNTTLLVTKDKNDTSVKIKKAKQNGIPILEKEEFEKKFLFKK
jgi:NAD-dependent DNA ligase